ncbi:610_t:CDS:2, partial [Scutellospora calospora]
MPTLHLCYNFCELVQEKDESREENRLYDKKVTRIQLIEKTTKRQEIEINSDSVNKNTGTASKPKRKLKSSIVDTLKLYNIADDILSLPTSATTNFNNFEKNHRITAARCYVRIHNNLLTAVLNSGAAKSIVSKRLLDKIGLEIDKKFTTVTVIVMRAKAKILEKVKNTKIVIQGITIPTTLQKLYLKYLDKSAEVPISNTGTKILIPNNEDEFDSKSRDTFDEFDYEEEEEPSELEGLFIKTWLITYEENSALYLTNIEEVPSKDKEDDKKSFKEKLRELLNNKVLSMIQKEKVKDLFNREKDLATVVERVEQAQRIVKKRYDQQLRVIENLKKGDPVLVYKASQATSKSNKLNSKWKRPFVILKVLSRGVYKLSTVDGKIIKLLINQ